MVSIIHAFVTLRFRHASFEILTQLMNNCRLKRLFLSSYFPIWRAACTPMYELHQNILLVAKSLDALLYLISLMFRSVTTPRAWLRLLLRGRSAAFRSPAEAEAAEHPAEDFGSPAVGYKHQAWFAMRREAVDAQPALQRRRQHICRHHTHVTVGALRSRSRRCTR